MTERHLAAVYAALLSTGAITGTAPDTYPVAAWVWDWMAKPHRGTAQTPMLAK